MAGLKFDGSKIIQKLCLPFKKARFVTGDQLNPLKDLRRREIWRDP